MYCIRYCAVLAACLPLLAAAPIPESDSYSVTILNDSSVGDFQGTVHTWLKFRAPSKDVTYFSFSHVDGATFKVVEGISSVDPWLKKRRPTESYKIKIDRNQYETMIAAIDAFYKSKPKYSVFPESDNVPNSYNCVTAANEILRAGGIKTLEGYLEPVFLGWRLSSTHSVLEKCLLRPNLFRVLFGFAFHKTLCLFL